MPLILGNEAAGVVTALGPGVTEVAVGDRVGYCGVGSNFFANTGAYAEERNVPAARLVKLPAGISDQPGRGADAQGPHRRRASSIASIRPKPGDIDHDPCGGERRRPPAGAMVEASRRDRHRHGRQRGQGAHRQRARLRPRHPLSRGRFRGRRRSASRRAASTRCSTASARIRSRNRSTAWRRSACW